MASMRYFVIIGSLLLGILTIIQPCIAATCTLTEYDEGTIRNAEKECAEIVIDGISVPAGVTLQINLKQGAKLTFQGTITWGYQEWAGPLVNITGTDVEIVGAAGHFLNGRGNLWWDGEEDGKGKVKPVSFVLHGLKNSVFHNIYIQNPPYHTIWIEECDGVVAEDVTVDSSDGDIFGGRNTDGIDVWKSNNVTIQRISIYNQDDCVSIKSGTNVLVTDSYCSGGHGLSIGSVGGRDYNIVENVLISNSEVSYSENGIRIKTNYGTTGSVTNVTYENIILTEMYVFGIKIHGDYGSNASVATDGVPITDLTLKNITGTVKQSGANVYILVKNASDWYWSDVNVTGGEVDIECDGVPEGSNITCD